MPTLAESRKRAKDERLQAHRIDDTTYRVYNVAKGTSYDVIQTRSGAWICTCPYSVKGSHIRAGQCKHLTRVQDKINGSTCDCGSNQGMRDGKCVGCRAYEKVMNG